MSHRLRRSRGSALVVVLALTTIMTLLVAAAIVVSGQDRKNAGKIVRNTNLQDLTEATLQFGRAYFTQNFTLWNTYLAYFAGSPSYTNVTQQHPELVFPGANGTEFSCIIYLHDDIDELPPAANNPSSDNNLRVFVGAYCTMNPFATPRNLQYASSSEMSAPLAYNPAQTQCQAQFSGGTQGLNNCSTPIGYR
jgi:hypothetical protein